MKINKLIMVAVSAMMCLAVHAQSSVDFTPKKGDLTLAATLGYNSYTSVTALPGTLSNYEGAALSTNWAEKQMMVGFEAGWFVSDNWKLSLAGGFNMNNNPGYAAVPGTMDENASAEDNMGEIPSYRAVANAYSLGYNISLGIDRYFPIKNIPNLMWYGGMRVGAAYGLNEQKYDEYESMGKSSAETINLRGALTCGFDYFLSKGFYVGAQIDPFAYTYNMTAYKPQEGLSTLDADSHNYSVLAAPTLKVGIKF